MISALNSFRFLVSGLLLNFAIIGPATASASEDVVAVQHRSIPLDCGGWFSGFAMHSSGRLYGFGDVFGMWRSDDSGMSWNYLQGDFTTSDQFVNGCAVSAGDADIVSFLGNDTLFLSTDGGTTWQAILEDVDSRRDRGATPLIFHPRRDSEIWVTTTRNNQIGTLWRTLDKGATWLKMGGETFDYVTATGVYIHPRFPNQVWVGAVGGLYVSSDLGATFTRVWDNTGGDTPFLNAKPTVGAMVRRDDGVGYMVTNTKGWRISATDYTNPATYKVQATVSWWTGWGPANATVLADGSFLTNGPREPGRPDDDPESLMRSTDGGLTWTPLPMRLLTPPTPSWHKPARPDQRADGGRDMIVQDPANPDRWHMTGGGAPVISEDAGQTWRFPPNANGLAGVPTFKTRFVPDNPLLALIPGSDHGGFIVTDGGLSGEVFASIRTSIDRLQTHHQIMADRDGTVLIAAGVDQSEATLILRSVDGGATWVKQSSEGNGLPRSSEGITRAIASLDNIDDFLVLLGSGGASSNPGLYRTTDGGITFRKIDSIPDNFETGARYHPENAWLETDGVLRNTRYLSLRGNRENPGNHVWRSTDGGDTWAVTREEPFPGDWIACLAVDHVTAGRVWVSSGRGLKRSDDGADSWTSVGNFKSVKRVDAARGKVAVWGRLPADTWDKVYYSPDDGATWIEQTGPGFRYANLSDLAINPHNTREIWVSGMSINIITASTNPPVIPTASAALAPALIASSDDPFPVDTASAPAAPAHELFPEEPSATLAATQPLPAVSADDPFPEDASPASVKFVAAAATTAAVATSAPSDDEFFPSNASNSPASTPRKTPASSSSMPDDVFGDAPTAPSVAVAASSARAVAVSTTQDDIFPAEDDSGSMVVSFPAKDPVFPGGRNTAQTSARPPGVVIADADTPDDLFPEDAVPAPAGRTQPNPLIVATTEDTVFAPSEEDPFSGAAAAAPAQRPAAIAAISVVSTEDDVFWDEDYLESDTDTAVASAGSASSASGANPPGASVAFTYPPAPSKPTATTAKRVAPPAAPARSDEIFRPIFRGPKNRSLVTQPTDK
jgi:photosystem II stability/assembly factor-like uncharacterized protein